MLPSQGLSSADSVKPTGAVTPADALEVIQRMATENAESEESYECPKCAERFPSKHSCGVHFWAAHDENLQEYERRQRDSGVQCPSCERDDFGSKRAMRLHHYQSHGESIAYDTYECDWCGEVFEELECLSPRFCKQKCADKGRIHTDKPWLDESRLRDLYLEQGLSARKIATQFDCGHVTIMEALDEYGIREGLNTNVCPHCSKGFHHSNSLTRHVKTSHEESFRQLVSEVCDSCGSDLQLRPSVNEKYERHFCDTDCRSTWQAENQSDVEGWPPKGSDSAVWEGGPYEYGEGWNDEKKESIRSRDGYECQDCGMTNPEHKAEYGRALDVHHIRRAREFDDDQKCNDPGNLITFCIPCHNKWEGIPLRPETE